MSLAVLVATPGTRPDSLQRLARSVRETVPFAHLYVLLWPEAPPTPIEGAETFRSNAPFGYPKGINWLAKKAVKDDTTWMLMGSDDIVLHEDWFEECLNAAFQGHQVVGTNDLGNPLTGTGELSTHSLVHRDYVSRGTIDGEDGLMWEGYRHCFADTEFVGTAKHRGAFTHAPMAKVEHMHPYWNKSEVDQIYEVADRAFESDRMLFNKRCEMWGGEPHDGNPSDKS